MPVQFIPAAEPRELLEQAALWMQGGQKVALLTLVNIEGNAPYPIGTQMLVTEEGVHCGQITGGCAELALSSQAKELIAAQRNTVERYGLNSKYFDIQLPCGSGIDVHFEVGLQRSEVEQMLESLRNRIPLQRQIDCDGFTYCKTYLPNERVLLCGQGPIKTSFIELASRAGFDVLDAQQGAKLEIADYADRYTALVSLFHEHDYEIDIFSQALEYDLFYFGALGSRKTHANRVTQLEQRGVAKSKIDKIHGPIGLDIGAVSPAQIAIAILAELIASMNQDGRFRA